MQNLVLGIAIGVILTMVTVILNKKNNLDLIYKESLSTLPEQSTIIKEWDYKLIYKAIEQKDSFTEKEEKFINILQTWIPEGDFWIEVRKRLETKVKSTDIYLKVFLIGHNALLSSRIQLRSEKLNIKKAKEKIEISDSEFKKLNNITNDNRDKKVNVEVKYYSHMPFGPIIMVYDKWIFTGVYLCNDTSDKAYMLILKKGHPLWDTFEEQLSKVANNSENKDKPDWK